MVTAVGTCSAAETEAVKNAFLEFLSNPTTSYGVYTPGLTLEVSCIVAGDFQVSYCTSQPVLRLLADG